MHIYIYISMYISISNYGHFIPHIYFIYYTPCLVISSKYFQRQLFSVALVFFWGFLFSSSFPTCPGSTWPSVTAETWVTMSSLRVKPPRREHNTCTLTVQLGFFLHASSTDCTQCRSTQNFTTPFVFYFSKTLKSNLGAPDNSDQWPI